MAVRSIVSKGITTGVNRGVGSGGGGGASGGGGDPLLLDTYTGASVAYSLRKLRTAYTGNCIRVRRSSDSAEQDIGFASNVLDTAALLTFCGAGDGFVTTWYDQQNENNAIQSTANNQPKIYDSSAGLVTLNSKPAISFDGGDKLSCGAIGTFTQHSVFAVVKSDAVGFNAFIEKAGTSNQNSRVIWIGVDNNSPTRRFVALSHGSSASGGDGSVHSIVSAIVAAGSQSYLYVNGTTVSNFTAGLERFSTADVFLGGAFSLWRGQMQELILFNTLQNDIHEGVELNQSNEYGITLA